ncbi:DUF1800 family protein [Aquincola sp. S2]|uniref:DUF1800 family protein n=1 Tax=Pseudaquabacterium terrae TaxID=2732868 RepID=A0ABX2EGY4_9BURK|nr:DUF1800 family protein [Aquabacterium terrae]NRF67852.1 DUF1800 family protein [Aquabacterium terrae]
MGHNKGRRVPRHALVAVLTAALLAACGGGTSDEGAPAAAAAADDGDQRRSALAVADPKATELDAVRLANQASFGPTQTMLADIRTKGTAVWVRDQLLQNSSRYALGGGDAVHKNVGGTFFCDTAAQSGNPNCWRDWFSAQPLVWDFYRNATTKPDQLRQRVAFALQQIAVVSELEVSGTYGLRNYHNALLANAFGNYRDVLKKVILSPVMGDYLDQVNNDKTAPNENFARELLQLFSLGPCLLQRNGQLSGGSCMPTYDNQKVREYAFALTGWTYPAGGSTAWGCWPQGANCTYYGGDMVAAPLLRNTAARQLLSGGTVPAGATAPQALEAVLDSLINHPNIAPFVGQRLIQHLVMSNPSPGYVDRVAQAFIAGRFVSTGITFGTGRRGDLAATVAAVLLDAEARDEAVAARRGGALRPPALLFTGVLRALGGKTDGEPFGWWWGEVLRQHLFRPPSVFNFYPPNYPVAGTALVGPEYGIHNANAALERLNYLTYLLEWGGSAPVASVPGATGTSVSLNSWTAQADNPATLVDSLSLRALGRPLAAGPRTQVINAVSWWTAQTGGATWRTQRVRAAAWLVFASPDYQVQR